MTAFNYQKAMDELLAIQQTIQQEEIPIPQLIAKAKRAKELTQLCKNALREAQADLDSLLDEEE